MYSKTLNRHHPIPLMLILLNFKAHVIGSMAFFAPMETGIARNIATGLASPGVR
jgi:hypothetical protein